MSDTRPPLCPSCGQRWPLHSARTCSHLVPMPSRFRDLVTRARDEEQLRQTGQDTLPLDGVPDEP
jgi:hypothetical protein